MRRLPDRARLEADVCIVGAGPAGIAIAAELSGLDLDLLVLESGGLRHEEQIQDLNEGIVVGDAYAGLRETRCRGAGGAAQLWNTPTGDGVGAKYVPLDRVDFEERPAETLSGWPFDRMHLERFYKRAQVVCGLGPFRYEANDWLDGRADGLVFSNDRVTTGVYQFGRAGLFTKENVGALRAASNTRLCHHATVLGLRTNGSGSRVVEAKVGCLSGKRIDVRATVFVLATGTIENARLLLVSSGSGSHSLGNRHGWVGRCFMEHPRDHALTLVPTSAGMFTEAWFYDAHQTRDGTIVGGRLTLRESQTRDGRLPNASATLLPREKATRPATSHVRSAVRSRLRAFPLWLGGHRSREGYGWSRVRNASTLFDAFRVIANVEQRPNPENRVVLGSRVDAMGVPRVELHWRWRDEEQRELERLRATLASGLEEAGRGRVETQTGRRPDPNAHHHAGTTRMATDPRFGVVDSDGRVHGVENLYVAGASVFPTAGFANPTLTIVALAIRLAERLKGPG